MLEEGDDGGDVGRYGQEGLLECGCEAVVEVVDQGLEGGGWRVLETVWLRTGGGVVAVVNRHLARLVDGSASDEDGFGRRVEWRRPISDGRRLVKTST